MIYREFGRTGWQVSAVGMGCWNIGNQWGEVDEVTAHATIHAALDHGCNLFDVADSYGIPHGLSEERVGRALAGRRHQVYLVTKFGNWGKRTGRGVPTDTVDMIRLCCHASLHRLRTDWVDVALCHIGNISDPSVFLEAFAALQQEGRVRAYGISTNSLDVLQRFHADGGCQVVELDYSLLNRQPEEDLLPYCQEHGISVLARGVLAMGLLSGRYDSSHRFTDTVRGKWHENSQRQAQFEADVERVQKLAQVVAPGVEMVTAALRYAISHGAAPVAIPGAKSPQQAATNCAAGDSLLTADERDELVAALA